MRNNSDLEIVFGKEYDMAIPKKPPKPYAANTGTVWATKASMHILDMWIERNADFINDQRGDEGAMHEILKDPEVRRHAYQIPTSVIGQCAVKGTYATHYNCYGNKRTPMRRKRDWDPAADADLEPVDDIGAKGAPGRALAATLPAAAASRDARAGLE